MIIKSLNIVNFKNISDIQLKFCAGVNCFVGKNGAGKTNIMDAIYYLSMCKSYFNVSDVQNIKHKESYFILNGKYDIDEEVVDIYCGVKKGNKKMFKKNDKQYAKLSEHIGFIPLVVVSPEDSTLIIGGSLERRKFIDGMISQYDSSYLNSIIRYNRALMQRNSLLKSNSGKNLKREDVEIWDEQLGITGKYIMQARSEFVEKFKPLFQKYYNNISGLEERVNVEYKPSVEDGNLFLSLTDNFERDRILTYTSKGIQRDDITLYLGDYAVRKVASQGQKKSFLIAMKFAQFSMLRRINGDTPILLLDDIFDKLDKNRVNNIIDIVGSDIFSQIFISDTNREHIDDILVSKKMEYSLININDGNLI
ncbi:MAG: DNA replication and repair protein RecF [Bacilli bacterium]